MQQMQCSNNGSNHLQVVLVKIITTFDLIGAYFPAKPTTHGPVPAKTGPL